MFRCPTESNCDSDHDSVVYEEDDDIEGEVDEEEMMASYERLLQYRRDLYNEQLLQNTSQVDDHFHEEEEAEVEGVEGVDWEWVRGALLQHAGDDDDMESVDE